MSVQKLCLRLAAILCVATSLPIAAHAQATSETGSSAAVLAPGDAIRITVWRRPELSGDFTIAQDGTISHPLYKELSAAGVPMSQLEAKMRTFLTRFEATPAFVIVPLFHVFVGGEVRNPAMLTVPPGTTLAQVISMSGGPTEDGRLDQVHLFRDLRRAEIDLTGPDPEAARQEVHSGDQITVGRRTRFVRDRLLPTATVVAALGSVVNLVLLTTRH
jgi:protein involved in polysaccharide export with SLBB domain